MPISSGTKLGPYEIIDALGAGGMGEVYRARDTRLERTVAIKVIPGHLSSAPDLKQRFDREAKAISRISHPHICALHDVGSQDGTNFLVMEYLEGETLQQRLQKGLLPLEQVLRYAVEISGALDTAHRQGIIHRDLKPANIMLTKTGAKLLDFGLAKLLPTVTPLEAELTAMTADRQITEKGTIIGTFQYMAPEQLEGKEADARTDIFAFGAVLYEMLTSQPAFTGRSKASLIAAILSLDPPAISGLQPMAPPALDRIIRTCLAKEPDERFQSAHDLRLQLSWIDPRSRDRASSATAQASRIGISSREKLLWAAVLALVAGLLFLVPGYFHSRNARPPQIVRTSLLPPPNNSFIPNNFAISPDGTRLAFASLSPDGHTQLWVRSLGAAAAQQLGGSEDAMYPFWAPDSRRIGFFANGKLKAFDLDRGSVQTICDAVRGRGGTWNRDDVIVFAPEIYGPLFRVSATGGRPAQVTKLPREGSGQAHRWPSFLPDGRHFVFLADWSSQADQSSNGTYIGSLDSNNTSMLSSEITSAAYFSSGYLVYVSEHSLLAQPFDADHLRLTATPIPIAPQELEQDYSFGSAGFSVSGNGTIVFRSESDAPSQLVWFDHTGKELGPLSDAAYKDPALSPDGGQLAVSSDDQRNGKRYIRLYDLTRNISTRLTRDGNEETPAWSPDGRAIAYASRSANSGYIHRIFLDGSKPPEVLAQGARMSPNDWSPDGRYLLYMNFEKGPPDIWIYDDKERKHSRLVRGAEAHFSPDGKSIAFSATSGGISSEVFVCAFSDAGNRIQISTSGAAQSRWSRDGRKLFYIAPDRKLMAVDVDTKGKFTASVPRPLFQTHIVAANFAFVQYDVTRGDRFIINSLNPASPLTLLTNWTSQLRKD